MSAADVSSVAAGRPSPIWAQSLYGHAIDLVDPAPADVDFREIAHALAGIHRYAGNAATPVSVAFHTLIAADAAEPDIKPYVLLHDAHESRLGDITTPCADALDAMLEAGQRGAVRKAIARLKATHDVVIWKAAGLPPPLPGMAARIQRCDIVALNTERRDFLAPSPKRWSDLVESVPPSPHRYGSRHYGRSPFDVAERLYAEFKTWLPALAGSDAPRTEGSAA